MCELIERELIAKANQLILEAQCLRRERVSLRAEAVVHASELGETVLQVRAEERRAGAPRASASGVYQGEEVDGEVSAPHFAR